MLREEPGGVQGRDDDIEVRRLYGPARGRLPTAHLILDVLALSFRGDGMYNFQGRRLLFAKQSVHVWFSPKTSFQASCTRTKESLSIYSAFLLKSYDTRDVCTTGRWHGGGRGGRLGKGRPARRRAVPL